MAHGNNKPFTQTGEPTKVDTSLSSKMEAIRKIVFLKRFKAARPDRLSVSFFKISFDIKLEKEKDL